MFQKAMNIFTPVGSKERPITLNYGYDIDVKFINEDLYEGTVIKIVQAKLFRTEEYFSNATDSDSKKTIQSLDNMRVLEIETMGFKLNLLNKGGNTILSDYSSNSFKRHACKLEFIGNRDPKDQVITRFDNKAKLCIIALNSMHMYYCQCYFYSPETSFGYQVKLFNLVKPNDHPSFDAYGKTSLWIDDIQWSENDLTCIVLFRAKSIAIMTRLGSLVRFIIDPSMNIPQNMKSGKENMTTSSKRFHELVFPQDVSNADSNLLKKKLRNKFKLSNDTIMSLLSWCEKEELGF